MATFQQWNYPLPEATYNPATSANISSFFVRPNKVVKSGSRNSSPRTLARRKTMTAAPGSSRNRSVVDHLRSSSQWQNSENTRSRPVSWHPDSFEASNSNFHLDANGEDLSSWNFSTIQINGLVTPIAYPSMNEPQIQELFTPLDELQAQDPNSTYESQPYHEQPWTSQGQGKTDPYSLPLYSQQPFIQPTWHFNQIMMAPNVPTAPASPDCQPLQNIGLDTLSLGNKDSTTKDDSEELVGMGLYDSPAEVQSSSLLFGGSSGSGRKGLKLEESFEPEEQEAEEEEEEEDDDDDDEEAEEDEQKQQSIEQENVDENWNSFHDIEYDSHSIANHLTYGIRSQPDPLASKYLATLRQMNSAYYPSGYQGHGWI